MSKSRVNCFDGQDTFEVINNTALLQPGSNPNRIKVPKLFVGDAKHYSLIAPTRRLGNQVDPIFDLRLLRTRPGVMDLDVQTELAQGFNDIDNSSIPQVRAIFLEGQAEDQDAGSCAVAGPGGHQLDQFAGDEIAHAIIGSAASQNHLRVETDLLGLVGQVIGVDADAVAANKSRLERQEVSLGARCFEHVTGVQPQAREQHGQLVDQGNVYVALGVLDHLGRFGYLDTRCLVGAGGYDGSVQVVDVVGHFRSGACGDLLDRRQAVGLVARVDPFRGVPDEETSRHHFGPVDHF